MLAKDVLEADVYWLNESPPSNWSSRKRDFHHDCGGQL